MPITSVLNTGSLTAVPVSALPDRIEGVLRFARSGSPSPLHIMNMTPSSSPVLGPFGIAVVLCLVAACAWYLRCVRRLRLTKARGWSPIRTFSFAGGLLSVFAAVVWPIAPRVGSSFSVHVQQHIALMNVAPILFAASAPATLGLQTCSRRSKVLALRVLRSLPSRLAHFPLVSWSLFYGGMYAFFLSRLIADAMGAGGMWEMDSWNVFFLLSGCLLWWPVVGTDPIPYWRLSYPARMLSLFLGLPLNAFLGIALSSAQTSVVPGLYSLGGTQIGGGVLWAAGELFSIAPLCIIVVQWLRSEDREVRRSENPKHGAGLVAPRIGRESDWQGRWIRHGKQAPLILDGLSFEPANLDPFGAD